jgi:Sulfotransferase family
VESTILTAEYIAHAPTQPVRYVEDIGLWSVTRLIRRTIEQDRRIYVTTKGDTRRALTTRRILSSIYPRLRRPIFIIGAPRSGTTFLGKCVAALPQMSYHFEPVATKAAGRYVFEGRWSFATGRIVFSSVYRLLLQLHVDGDLRFVEKTPQNCFLVSFLARAFPDATFVHIIRDGRAAAFSYSKKPWLLARSASRRSREPGGYLLGPYARHWVESNRRAEFESTTDFHRCIWAWRLHTESALRQATTLRRGAYYELRYEHLVNRPIEEARRLLTFLGITENESVRRFESAVQRASTASLDGWKQQLTASQMREADMEAGGLLRQLGYVA